MTSLTFSPVRPTRRHALAGLVGLSLVALAGCRDKASTTASPSSAPTAASPSTNPATSDPTSTPASQDADAAADQAATGVPWHEGDSASAESSADAGVETDLRVGHHEGYDRVVVQTNGAGPMGYQVDVVTVEEAATQGKGEPVSVEGSHVIRVIGRGTHMPISETDVAATYTGPRRLTVGGQALREVVLDPTFEGQFQLFLGVESTTYRVFTLTAPSRLVIDVRH